MAIPIYKENRMDKTSKAILIFIALILCFIAFKLHIIETAISNTPKLGDFIDLSEMEDSKKIEETQLRLMRNLPLMRIKGGDVNAEVSGSVSVEEK